jgi:hypothetical protein
MVSNCNFLGICDVQLFELCICMSAQGRVIFLLLYIDRANEYSRYKFLFLFSHFSFINSINHLSHIPCIQQTITYYFHTFFSSSIQQMDNETKNLRGGDRVEMKQFKSYPTVCGIICGEASLGMVDEKKWIVQFSIEDAQTLKLRNKYTCLIVPQSFLSVCPSPSTIADVVDHHHDTSPSPAPFKKPKVIDSNDEEVSSINHLQQAQPHPPPSSSSTSSSSSPTFTPISNSPKLSSFRLGNTKRKVNPSDI